MKLGAQVAVNMHTMGTSFVKNVEMRGGRQVNGVERKG